MEATAATLERRVRVIPATRKPEELHRNHDGKMRVAAYCRVSTDSEEQLNSYEAQKTYYTQKIQDSPDWEMAGIYADEGISGTSLKKRTQFNKMITACKRGHIDLIITKSLSRFARNTVDCLDIEAVFEFEELQSGSNGGEYAIPIFFQHFVVDNPGRLPYLRIRLEATWEKSNTIDGSIDIIDFFGIGNIKAKFPAYKQGTYFMNVINQFESLFFEEYVAAHGVWNLAIENFRGDHSVPIMTIHKSKGLEYNAVYFIGLEDSAFWNFRNQPDEDRCTFFVALSRAKASVTFTFCKKRTGMKCPMQRHNAINEFFDLLQRPGIAEVKRFQNR